jgi:hypothetical protein
MITMQSWMFLSSYQKMREQLNEEVSGFIGTYVNLNDAPHSADKDQVFLSKESRAEFKIATQEFRKIPGSPVSYWVSQQIRALFSVYPPLGDSFPSRDGITTGDNDRFLRCWQEVNRQLVGLSYGSQIAAKESGLRWFPCNKGGKFRRWYGNNEYVINWENDGTGTPTNALGTSNPSPS